MSHIIALSGSNRRASLNTRLLRRAAARADTHPDVTVEVVELADIDFPLYSGDLQEAQGIGPSVTALFDRIKAADGVLFASPEHNGGYTAYLKNMIDWLSRVEMTVLAHTYVGVLAAAPGRGGGRRGAAQLVQLMEGMAVPVHPTPFTLPGAREALGECPIEGLDEWVDSYVEALLQRSDSEPAS